MTSREDDSSLSGAYALNALSETERQEFEAQLGESDETRNEVTELADTAVLLGLAVDPVDPPAALKESIMARLSSTPQLPRDIPPVRAIQPVTAFDGPAEARARTRWFTRPAIVLTAVAAAAALVIGGVVVSNTLGDTIFRQVQADQLAAINAADDSQRLVAEVAGGGTATLVWSGDLKSSALIVDGLEPLPEGKVYELWYIDGTGARPAGTFSVGETGGAWRVLDGKMGFGDIVGVTIEPTGGSPAPTTDPIVKFESA